jgi:hypothetical protein
VLLSRLILNVGRWVGNRTMLQVAVVVRPDDGEDTLKGTLADKNDYKRGHSLLPQSTSDGLTFTVACLF